MSGKRQSHRKPESQKCGSIADEWNGDTGDEGDDVWYDDGGEPALVVREPAEEECSGDGTGKEERLRQCRYPGLITNPVHVGRDGPMDGSWAGRTHIIIIIMTIMSEVTDLW